jgi:Domain of unknown function (DUF4476)
MKQIFTLLASLFLTISVFAAAKPKSTLTIQSADRSAVRVVIDGRRFEPNNSSIRISGIETGLHQVKIYKEKNNNRAGAFGKRYEVVFNSSLAIRSRSNVMITIDRFGRATVNDNRGNNDWARNRDLGNNDRDQDRNTDFDFDRGNRAGDYDNDRGGRLGDYDNHYGYESGMNDREFITVFQAIRKEWLESNKLKSASHIVTANRLSAAQVKQLVLLFSFEGNKLDLAKQAYTNTVDKRNYSILNDVFSLNSSKDELARFIRNFR